MSFEDNKVFWEEFISLYKEKTCLWEIKSKDYRNKHMKNAAYESLIEKCKELFPDANKDFVIKKISSLRSSFRRQIRRINEAKKSGSGADDIPESTLWYFELLTFLLDQEEVRTAVSSLANTNNSNDDETQSSLIDDQSTEESLPQSPQDIQQQTPKISRKRAQPTNVSWTKKRDEFIEVGIKALQGESGVTEEKPESQEITFGKNVGQQLESVDIRQKFIAQKLISDILFYAKMGQLQDNSMVSLAPQAINDTYPSPQHFPRPHNQQQTYGTNLAGAYQSKTYEELGEFVHFAQNNTVT